MSLLKNALKAGIAGLLGIAAVSCQKKPDAKAGGGTPATPKVTVAVPVEKEITEWDVFTGRLESPQVVQLRARVSGYLQKIHFKEGAEVNAGDLLVTIDPRPYQAALDGAKAEHERNQTRAELARNEATRGETLIKTRAIAASDRDTRVGAASEAAAAVRISDAAVKTAQLNLEFTEIRAPISGRISSAMVTEGNLVTADATLLTSIVSQDKMYCYIEVNEQRALKYRQLYRAAGGTSPQAFSVEAWMGLANEKGFPRPGVIDFEDNRLRADTGTIRFRGTFDNTDKIMAPGFFARVRIPGSAKYAALLVRDNAIGNDLGRTFVYVLTTENKVEYRTVDAGPLENNLRVIRKGLKPGEKIVINGLMNIRNGVAVQPEEGTMPLPEPPKAVARN